MLNEKLAAARADMQAGNFDQAVATMNEAIAIDANRDVVWATLGDANRGAASKQTDPALKAKNLADAAMDYQKAVDLKNQQMAEGKVKDPDANKKLAGYYNNMGDAFAKNGKTDDAVNSYNKAVQLDPSDAGKYYFNEGATMTNANVKNDAKMRTAASEAFDKAIAADPNRADAYYWKGTNLIGMATLKGDKMEAPPGTAEAFQKYLELQPTGPHADEAKAMITSLGASVETSFGKKKPGKK
ncbi:MAG: tetratricopeptide repeat protein [Acidobacteriales bacterium]|nr:tetratricopeptide repeat protein [Terriglobales bacterium]